MTITYTVKNGLYINLTNRCTNSCEFCIRQNGDGVYGSDSLWLEREPTVEEVLDDLGRYDLAKFEEVVFCGYGEPTERAEDMLKVASAIKQEFPSLSIRLNTNGHGNLIAGRDITPKFAGLLDTVSISLNCANAEDYNKVCHPVFGVAAYDGLLDFAKRCVPYVKNVILSVVDTTIPPEDIEKCKQLADSIGVTLRVRPFE